MDYPYSIAGCLPLLLFAIIALDKVVLNESGNAHFLTVRVTIVECVVRNIRLIRSVGVHHVDLKVPIAGARKGDLLAVF